MPHSAFASTLKGQWPHDLWQWRGADSVNIFVPGQFFQPFDFKVSDIRPGSDPTKSDATLVVKNHQLTVTRGSQKDYRKDASVGTKVVCWFVHNNGQGLIDGVHTDYVIPSLF
ncbi:Inter-alpha-trypsin inhibitor heavy chain H3 [Saguinus oedipus]|uniref:Inter-alpha-trypsin inhibitor heavy chain H3 n=1 Tax=Saguinus oedipus TaxID=9490 RepID=A0ABQ9U2J0_SAGOE|nr:Inter-alpha-trypsin inhibitor heavy chain H3 [Saguinus oedipus]